MTTVKNLDNELTHGSVFTGAGGFDLGAEMSGIPTIWNCEVEPHIRDHLKRRFPGTKQYDDIRNMQNPEYADIISGGFPCQDISVASNKNNELIKNGKHSGINGQRSGLWTEQARVIRVVMPKYAIIENSPALLFRGFEQVLFALSEIGYVCEWKCISASQFGYNHQRTRLYAIAYPMSNRCGSSASIFKNLSEIFIKKPSRQTPISMPFERFNSRSNYEHVRMDDGFSKGLDKRRIEMMGNAVIPEIAHYLFECIKQHNSSRG